jgi:hypothetical protein
VCAWQDLVRPVDRLIEPPAEWSVAAVPALKYVDTRR